MLSNPRQVYSNISTFPLQRGNVFIADKICIFIRYGIEEKQKGNKEKRKYLFFFCIT